MVHSVTIQPGNVNAYREKRDHINGVATCGNLIAIEYTSESRHGDRGLVVGHLVANKVWHSCYSTKKPTPVPCWHLGALATICGWSVPKRIDLELEMLELEDYAWVNETNKYIPGQRGSFRILDLNAKTDKKTSMPDESEESIPGLAPEDGWLGKYHLPEAVLNKVLAFREKQKERLTPEQVSRIPQPRYVPSGKEVIHAVASLFYGDGSQWEAPLLIGPKGSGKSTLAETLAAILYLPINKIFGGVDLNVESLLGGKTLVPDEAGVDEVTEAKLRATAKKAGIEIGPILEKLRGSQLKVGFEPGLLLQAVLAGEMIVTDEVNMINPEVTSLLHGLLDWQKVLAVPGYGVVQADSNFRLIGCMNFGYAGTRPLNEAFQDRFRSVSVPHLPKEQLANLLVSEAKSDPSTANKLADLFLKISARVNNGDLSERVLSVRSLIRTVREYNDGIGGLREITVSCLTSGISDNYETEQIKTVVESLIA